MMERFVCSCVELDLDTEPRQSGNVWRACGPAGLVVIYFNDTAIALRTMVLSSFFFAL